MGGKFFFNRNKVLGDVVDLVGQVKPYLRSVVVAREGGGIEKVDFLFLSARNVSVRTSESNNSIKPCDSFRQIILNK